MKTSSAPRGVTGGFDDLAGVESQPEPEPPPLPIPPEPPPRVKVARENSLDRGGDKAHRVDTNSRGKSKRRDALDRKPKASRTDTSVGHPDLHFLFFFLKIIFSPWD